MRTEQEKPTLCLEDGFKPSKPPSRWKGRLRETGGGTDPTSICQSSRRGRRGEADFTGKYPMGMNPWLTAALVRAGTRFRCPKRALWGQRGRGGTFPVVIQAG